MFKTKIKLCGVLQHKILILDIDIIITFAKFNRKHVLLYTRKLFSKLLTHCLIEVILNNFSG